MSHQFDEAPPLPREPTALNVPATMRSSVQQPDPLPSSSVPPPPKFPSLTDVDIASAQAAAANLSASAATTATTTPASTVEPVPIEQLPSTDQPHHTPFALPLSPDDIRAAIERDSVTPGSGAKKAVEVGHSIWTDQDQQTLDRLLKEGQSVYVPPDVGTNDLLVSRTSAYVYVPVPAEGVDDFAQDSPVSDRIDAWNQVVSKQHDQSVLVAPVATAAAVGATAASLSSAPAEQTQASSVTDDRGVSTQSAPVSSTSHTDIAKDTAAMHQSAEPSAAVMEETSPQHATESATTSTVEQVERAAPISSQPKSFDASNSIFASSFITVPVKSHVPVPDTDKAKSDTPGSEQLGKATQVKLRDDATAEIKILQDYGLKGGHEARVNDAAFIDDNTLITCGNDGKVCIWDVDAKHVRSEFVPYGGQSVTMVYPIPDDDPSQLTLMTFSEHREMRIWTVDSTQAVLLRTTTIQQSDKDLYMSIPCISKELKARAAAAVAAAAVTTTDTPQADTTEGATDAPPAPSPPAESKPDEEEAPAATDPTDTQAGAPDSGDKEEEKERKRFSLTKVLSFGRSGGRKAVAS